MLLLEFYCFFFSFMQFPGDKPGNVEDPASQQVDPNDTTRGQNQIAKTTAGEKQQNHNDSPVEGKDAMESEMIDLNMKPHW